MKSAKEMFKELGYKREEVYDDNDELWSVAYRTFLLNGRSYASISFDHRDVYFDNIKSISMDELEAINKQVKELRWK